MFCSVIFIFCGVIFLNAFPSETTRDKRQTFEIQDMWIWGYHTESPNKQSTRLVSLNPGDEIKNNNKQVIESTSDPPSTFTTTDKPFTSRIETSTDPTKTKEATLNIANTTESVLIKAINIPSAETTLLNVSTTTQTPADCNRYKKPSYRAPGRRISEAECLGYIWELYNRKREVDVKPHCGFKFWEPKDFIYVVGGRTAEYGEFPHMGAIGWKAAVGTWVFKCGSTLISPKFVLTAAHCSKASPRDSSVADPVPKIIRLGDKKITDKKGYPNSNVYTYPTDANISRIIVHPQYDPPLKYFDIALMELESPVKFTNLIQPACLWSNFSMGSIQNATLTGWGVIETGGLSVEATPQLMAATVDLLENDQCDDLLKNKHNRNWKGFQSHQMCAGKLEGGIDSCQGDSGGPLQVKFNLPRNITDVHGQMHYVVGVISFGIGCARENLPGIYTRVSSFIDWIEQNVWKNETSEDLPDTRTQSTPLLRDLNAILTVV